MLTPIARRFQAAKDYGDRIQIPYFHPAFRFGIGMLSP
jgi:hypothetical protein